MKRQIIKCMSLILAATLTFTACNSKAEHTSTSSNGADTNMSDTTPSSTTQQTELLSGKHKVNIIIKDKGTISVELDADVAPISTTNFINLAEAGFYDGVTFHRIIEDFMMQGGDPTGTGSGGSGETIKGEFSDNGVENNLSHTRGAISMARSQLYDSASSQFFIVHQDAPHLDGQYACFGYVTEGMEIVDDICENTKGGDYNGVIPVENRPVIETIEVVENGTDATTTPVVNTYWQIPVEDYEISLRDGTEENTLEVWVHKGDKEWSVLSFDTTNDYRTPEDISADTFEDILGHNGFRIHQYFMMGSSLEFCETDYFAVDEEPIHLAYSWGAWENRNSNDYSVDVDGDGCKELICNVQWLADGAEDALIYHWNGEEVVKYGGTDIMSAVEKNIDFFAVGSLGARYLPEENKIFAWHWDEDMQCHVNGKYDIDLEKVQQWLEEDESVKTVVYTQEDAIKIVQEQVILAYENQYGQFTPSDVKPTSTMHTDDKEYLAYTIPRLTVSEETEKYYIIPVIWDFLVDKQTGRVLVYYNGLDPFAYVFDPMAEGALAFAG